MEKIKKAIKSMPGVYRYTIDQLGKIVSEALKIKFL